MASEWPDNAFDVADLVPAPWDFPRACAVYLGVSRLLGLRDSAVFSRETPARIDLGDVHLVIFRGRLKPTTVVDVTVREDPAGYVEVAPRERAPMVDLSAAGTLAAALVRLPPAADGADERQARVRVETALGMLELVIHPGRIVEPLPPGILLRDRGLAFGPAVVVPGTGRPEHANGRLDEIVAIHAMLARLEPAQRESWELALRWARRAATLTGGDAFLAWWLALEALAADAADVVPALVTRLAEHSGRTPVQAAARYRIGGLYRLRADIVQGRASAAVDEPVLRYVAALFADLVRGAARLPPRAADRLLEDPEFQLSRYVGA